jgi:hypothetical protein
MSRQVIVKVHSRGEYEAVGIQTATGCLDPKILGCFFVVQQEPKNTPFDSHQNATPAVKHRWCNFVTIVEATIDETLGRQADVLPDQ